MAAVVCLLAALAWPGVARAATSDRPGGGHPRSEGGAYRLAAGPWAVRAIDRLVLKDPHRRRTVEITVRYPRVGGGRAETEWPLVVFVTAAGASHATFPELTAHWATYGYVVIVIAEAEAPARVTRHQQGHRPFDVDQLDRLADVAFVLDSLDQVERRMGGFRGRHALAIDRDRIAIAGYGDGALVAQMAIGVKVRVTAASGETELKNVADPRFRAAIIIAGQGTLNRLLTRESWNELSKPLLVVTGSRDVIPASRETPETRQEPFLLARPGQKFLVFIEGATHWSYDGGRARPSVTDEDVSEADLRMIAGATASATLAFLDAFLDNDERARDYLASDDLVKFSGGKVVVKRK